jgi:hypothetical protein
MKHFDPEYQYINDSPVDLSGIEGADKIHDSDYCRCEMCQHADAYEKQQVIDAILLADKAVADAICNDIDEVLMSLSPFALAWATAPESMRRHCEEDIARYFYTCGAQDVNKDALSDLKAMESMMKARGLK